MSILLQQIFVVITIYEFLLKTKWVCRVRANLSKYQKNVCIISLISERSFSWRNVTISVTIYKCIMSGGNIKSRIKTPGTCPDSSFENCEFRKRKIPRKNAPDALDPHICLIVWYGVWQGGWS